MLAVGMLRGKEGVHAFDLPKPVISKPDEVLIRVKEVGLDGTDFNMIKYNLQDVADGRDGIVLGHEMVGVVEGVGDSVTSLLPGDAVTVTVRRGCGQCHPCLHNQSDMCMTGGFTERGIHKLDGYLTEYLVDQEQYVIKVPPELLELAVLTEPLSIVEKGIEQIRIIQSRLPWTCPHPEHSFLSKDWGKCLRGLVIGAGPLGLLATALLRLQDIYTYVTDIVPLESPKTHLAKHMGAHYVDSRNRTSEEVMKLCDFSGNINIVFEASGGAGTAIKTIAYLAPSSIYVMTGIPRGDVTINIDAAQIVRQLVRRNQVIVGSVNSNRTHFEMALRDMGDVDTRFDGILKEMLTHRFRLDEFQKAFTLEDPKYIKTVIEVDPWN